MNEFRVTEDRRVFLNNIEIPRCFGFRIDVSAGDDPEVVLRVAVSRIDIDGYTDAWAKQTEL